jgi:hypothetical protein
VYSILIFLLIFIYLIVVVIVFALKALCIICPLLFVKCCVLCYFVGCVLFVLFLIVVPLPPGKNPFAV